MSAYWLSLIYTFSFEMRSQVIQDDLKFADVTEEPPPPTLGVLKLNLCPTVPVFLWFQGSNAGLPKY